MRMRVHTTIAEVRGRAWKWRALHDPVARKASSRPQPVNARADTAPMTKLILALLVIPMTALASPADDVADAMKAADRVRGVLEIKANDATASSDLGPRGLEAARTCSAAVDRAKAGGMTAASDILVDGYLHVSLGEIERDHCAKLAALATGFDGKTKAAKSKRDDRLTGPLKAAGVAGDKLAFALEWGKQDFDIYGAGGAILDAKGIKRASVLFLITGDRDHRWKLFRYRFDGDKLAAKTEESFRYRPAPSKFR
jgi:hypothetical protein